MVGTNVDVTNVGPVNTVAVNLTADAGYTIEISTVPAPVTYTPATLIYTANAATMTYGDSEPIFGGTVSGFVNGQNVGSATGGTLVFGSMANSTSSVGTYAITGSGLTANNGDYTFAQAAGNTTAFSITPAPLTYVADQVSIRLGQAIPPLDGTVIGFVNGQTQASATTGTLQFTSSATKTSPPGNYAIDGSGLTADDGNYTFIQATGNSTALKIEGYQIGQPGTPFSNFSAQFDANAAYATFFTQSWLPLFDSAFDECSTLIYTPGNEPHQVYHAHRAGYAGYEQTPRHVIAFGSSFTIKPSAQGH